MKDIASLRAVCWCLIVLVSSSTSLSQIPNAGFEFWETDADSNLNPVGWQTTNSFPFVNVERSTPACQGNYAMKVKTVMLGGFSIPGVAILETGHNFNQTPTRISACFKSTIMPGDQAYLIVGLMHGDSVIALQDSCTFKIDSTISQFTTRSFPLVLQSGLAPDSLIIIVASGLGFGQVGTELTVDELAFLGSTDVSEGETLPRMFFLRQNYPNPFNPSTTISYGISRETHVELKVYDLLGREVAVLVNDIETPGSKTVRFDASGLTAGVYCYRLQAGAFVATKKLLVLK